MVPKGGNDVVMTPEWLAERIVGRFGVSGRVLEPCRGSGSFFKFMPKGSLWCELSEGKDFFDFDERVDWIVTNPPFSKMRAFLQHSMKVSDNVVFLCPINHFWLKARIRDIKGAGFGFREILLVDTPKEFPQSGFQWGVVHLQRGYVGSILFGDL